MTIKLTRKTSGIICVYIAFILPYIEIHAVREIFEYSTNSYFFPAVFPIMIFLLFFFKIGNSVHKTEGIDFSYIEKPKLFFWLLSLYYLFGLLLKSGGMSSFAQWLKFVLPFALAFEMIKYVIGTGVTSSEISYHGMCCFVVSQLVFLAINITRYGFSFDGDIESRVISVGGGPVILGYTAAIVVALYLCVGKRGKIQNLILLSSCVLIVLSTGSRGGMWPLIVMLFCYLASKNGHISPLKIISAFLLFLFAFYFVDWNKIAPRLFDLSESGRLTTFFSCLYVFSSFSFIDILFGKGMGMFFPYQRWYIDKTAGFFNYNQFIYDGTIILVQPHNSYIYTLEEGGILGLVLFVSLVKALTTKYCNGTRDIEEYLFVALIWLLFFVESTIYIITGSAFLWWFLLLTFSMKDVIPQGKEEDYP